MKTRKDGVMKDGMAKMMKNDVDKLQYGKETEDGI